MKATRHLVYIRLSRTIYEKRAVPYVPLEVTKYSLHVHVATMNIITFWNINDQVFPPEVVSEGKLTQQVSH